MFSVAEKRAIADAVQRILRETQHPELPAGEISFHLHVDGAASWSWADIKNNGAVPNPTMNPWNEQLAQGLKCGECLMNDVEIVTLVNGICPRCGADYHVLLRREEV